MKRALFIAVFLLVRAFPAAAQEAGQVGLSVGFPGSIGITWHATEAIAIRPDFSFSHQHTDSTTSSVETGAWGIGFGASALFYTGTLRDNVRTYVTPRFGYSRTNTDLTGPFTNPTQHQDSYQYSGAFGVQYMPTRRFSVYGEAGLAYSHSAASYTIGTSTGVPSEGKSTNTAFGTRAGVGIVWYFR
jgi:opacity protein-like surface antigen